MKKIFLSSLLLVLFFVSSMGYAAKNPVMVLAKTWCAYLTGCCTTLTQNDCMAAFLNETSISDEFGVDTGKPFKGLLKLLKAGIVTVDASALLSCIEETQNMQCSYLTDKVDCADPTDLHNLEDIIGVGSPENLARTGADEFTPSCNDVFSK